MILRANIRSNGPQLAEYLVTLKDNSNIEILEVDGYEDADAVYLYETLMGMQLNSELTKSNKAFFNVQINPAYSEDSKMTREDWYKAADILAAEIGFENQRRVIVLHTKKGRTHAHVVWERYNHDTGRMIDNKHSRLKVDRARPKIEEALSHRLTPYRNRQQTDLKEAVTGIWNKTQTGAEFLQETRKAGYIVASGTGNRPYMIVDENGRAFDLVRQIGGVRTKDVRARLRHETLMTDKQAIELIREKADSSARQERRQTLDKATARQSAAAFADNRNDTVSPDEEPDYREKLTNELGSFEKEADTITGQSVREDEDLKRKEQAARQFAENRMTEQSAADAELQKIIAEQERVKRQRKQRKPRR